MMNDRIAEVLPRFDALPRAQLGFFPTPLQRLDRLSAQLGAVAFAGVNAQAAAVLEDQRASDGGAGNFAAESVQRVALPKGDEKRRIIVELRLRCGDGQCLSVDDGQHAVIVAFSQRGQAHEERDGQRGNGGVARRE